MNYEYDYDWNTGFPIMCKFFGMDIAINGSQDRIAIMKNSKGDEIQFIGITELVDKYL